MEKYNPYYQQNWPTEIDCKLKIWSNCNCLFGCETWIKRKLHVKLTLIVRTNTIVLNWKKIRNLNYLQLPTQNKTKQNKTKHKTKQVHAIEIKSWFEVDWSWLNWISTAEHANVCVICCVCVFVCLCVCVFVCCSQISIMSRNVKKQRGLFIQYNTIQFNSIQYNTIQYNTIQYNTIQYNTIQFIICINGIIKHSH